MYRIPICREVSHGILQLDIIVGTFHLEDQIEWDIDSQDPAPEQFAEVYAKDLGLSGEFK